MESGKLGAFRAENRSVSEALRDSTKRSESKGRRQDGVLGAWRGMALLATAALLEKGWYPEVLKAFE